MDTLSDNLVRVRPDPDGAQVRTAEVGDGRTLHGHFSVFDTWYEVNSVWEGHFLERTMPGAFERTLTQRGPAIKAQYEHGKDPYIGSSVLGPFTTLREDEQGGYYEISLIDTDYNRDRIIPQARAGLLGASFRFSVPKGGDKWVDHPGKSEHNPLGLPERSIHDSDVFELGPVVFGASPSATAAMRSGTDDFIDRLLNDPVFLVRYAERVGPGVVEKFLASLPSDGRSATTNEPADAPLRGLIPNERTRALRLAGVIQ